MEWIHGQTCAGMNGWIYLGLLEGWMTRNIDIWKEVWLDELGYGWIDIFRIVWID